MDELTRERFGFGIPWSELRTRPSPPPPREPRPPRRFNDPPEVVAERRRVLCEVELPSWLLADRRLIAAIRRVA